MNRYKHQPAPEGQYFYKFTTSMTWLDVSKPKNAFLALEQAGWELEAKKATPSMDYRYRWMLLPSGYYIVAALKPFLAMRDASMEIKKVTGLNLADGQYYSIDDPIEENDYFYALAMLDEYGDKVTEIEGIALETLAVKYKSKLSMELLKYIDAEIGQHFSSPKYMKKRAACTPAKSIQREFEDVPMRVCK